MTINTQNQTTRIIMSSIILLILLIMAFAIVLVVRQAINKKTVWSTAVALLVTIVFVPIIVLYASYAYPFDVQVDLEFVDSVDLYPDDRLDTIANDSSDSEQSWYCLYNYKTSFIDLIVSEELLSDDESGGTKFTFLEVLSECPKADFSKYTYLVSIGHEVKSLKYNVWDCKGPPLCDLNFGPKWGHVERSQKFDNKLYIYRFPKKAINNPAGTKYSDRGIYKITLFD